MHVAVLGVNSGDAAWSAAVADELRRGGCDVWFPLRWADLSGRSESDAQATVDIYLDGQIDGIAATDQQLVYLCGRTGFGARVEFVRMLSTWGAVIHVVIDMSCPDRHYLRAHLRYARARVTEHPDLKRAVAAIIAASREGGRE